MTIQYSAAHEGSILVVDDNQHDIWVLEAILEKEGYRVQSVLNGKAALAAVHTVRYDIILLDITMPGLDGYDVCRQLKADPQTQEIPIIFISALDEVRDKVKAFAVGGVDYVSKPFQPEEVLARVTTHLTIHHMRQYLAAQNINLQQEILERRRVEAELHRHRQQLEALVAARTADLQAANEQLQREIAERTRAEVEREALIQELEARNTELERFTYTVSHDLKSPLVTICGFLGYLEQDAQSGNTERLKQDIQRITDAATRMQHLLDELLQLSRVGRNRNPSEKVPFEQIVYEAVSLVEGRLRNGRVKLDIAQDSPCVWVDRMQLVQAMQNLVDNAVKFMGDQPDPCIRIGWRQQGAQWVFFVADNGIGIVPAYHEKVFGLFDKLDPHSDGTGIGLALVKRIIDIHGGRIWIESQGKSTGTTIYFTLPTGTIPLLA